MSETVWSVPVGDDAQFAAWIYDSNDKPIVTYQGNEPLTVKVWQGEDLAAVPDIITVDFTDPSTALTTATIHGPATALLVPEWYRVELDITVGDYVFPYYEGWLELQASAGQAVAQPVYCTYQDVIDLAGGWLPKMQSKLGETVFLAERAKARYHFDKVILARVRPASYDFRSYIASGYSSGQLISDQDDQYIKGLLAANKLLVTSDVKEANAYLALSMICEKQLTWDDTDVFAKRAAFYQAKWRQRVSCITAEIDTNNDGVGDLVINLGVMSNR